MEEPEVLAARGDVKEDAADEVVGCKIDSAPDDKERPEEVVLEETLGPLAEAEDAGCGPEMGDEVVGLDSGAVG